MATELKRDAASGPFTAPPSLRAASLGRPTNGRLLNDQERAFAKVYAQTRDIAKAYEVAGLSTGQAVPDALMATGLLEEPELRHEVLKHMARDGLALVGTAIAALDDMMTDLKVPAPTRLEAIRMAFEVGRSAQVAVIKDEAAQQSQRDTLEMYQ
jgi:hypothetical protein